MAVLKKTFDYLIIAFEIIGVVSVAAAVFLFVEGTFMDGLLPLLNSFWIFITLALAKMVKELTDELVVEKIRSEALRDVAEVMIKGNYPVQSPPGNPVYPYKPTGQEQMTVKITTAGFGATPNENIIPMPKRKAPVTPYTQEEDEEWIRMMMNMGMPGWPHASSNPLAGYEFETPEHPNEQGFTTGGTIDASDFHTGGTMEDVSSSSSGSSDTGSSSSSSDTGGTND